MENHLATRESDDFDSLMDEVLVEEYGDGIAVGWDYVTTDAPIV